MVNVSSTVRMPERARAFARTWLIPRLGMRPVSRQQVDTGSHPGKPYLMRTRPHGQPLDDRPCGHAAVEARLLLPAQRGAALDTADVVHDLEYEREMVGVLHQRTQPIVVDAARRAAVRAGRPEQGAGVAPATVS